MFGFDEITPELLANPHVRIKAYFEGEEMKFIVEIGGIKDGCQDEGDRYEECQS